MADSGSDDVGAFGSWLALLGQDADSLQAFYRELFGWCEVSSPPRGTASQGAGLRPNDAAVAYDGGGWTTLYVEVDNIHETLQRALERGGRQLVPVTQLPDVAIAVIADPLGHPVGLSQDLTGASERV